MAQHVGVEICHKWYTTDCMWYMIYIF